MGSFWEVAIWGKIKKAQKWGIFEGFSSFLAHFHPPNIYPQKPVNPCVVSSSLTGAAKTTQNCYFGWFFLHFRGFSVSFVHFKNVKNESRIFIGNILGTFWEPNWELKFEAMKSVNSFDYKAFHILKFFEFGN